MLIVTTLAPEILERMTNFTAGADAETVRLVQEMRDAALAGNAVALAEAVEAFGRDLDFGTGGLRGLMGPGTNRMNCIMVARATQGLAQYVKSQVEGGSIAIAFDSRNSSPEFARMAARVVAGNGLTAYLFEELRPTPVLSYAVRKLGATAGIVVTASHNPKEYSGYKVSWSDGAQVLPPHDRAIISQVRSVESMEQVKLADFDEAVKAGSIVLLGTTLDDDFLQALDVIRLRPEMDETSGGDLSIVFTPLHGTGITMVPPALARWGFSNVILEPQQSVPDGNFPTTKSPNPEEKEALHLALTLAEREQADIVLATDPDADRLGFAVRHQGDYQLITGNQGCALLAWYIGQTLTEQGRLPHNAAMVTTIVTTSLMQAVAEHFNIHIDLCLTGFKHIASVMREYEQPGADGKPRYTYLYGCEESYGYLIGTHCRDKDAVGASCLVAEMTLWAKQNGMTLVDMLSDLYCRFGVHNDSQISKTMPGLAGMKEIADLMDRLRTRPPAEVEGIAVVSVTDIETDTRTDMATGQVQPGPGLPKSNVLIFKLADGSTVVARPSGTEPKIKYYFMVVDRENLPIAPADLPARVAQCNEKERRLHEAWLAIVG